MFAPEISLHYFDPKTYDNTAVNLKTALVQKSGAIGFFYKDGVYVHKNVTMRATVDVCGAPPLVQAAMMMSK